MPAGINLVNKEFTAFLSRPSRFPNRFGAMQFIPTAPRLALASLALCAASSTAAELIDPAAFGFGRPGYMLDTTWVGRQDFDGLAGGVEMFELRLIAPLAGWKLGDGRLGISLGYNYTRLDFSGPLALGRQDLHNLEAQLAYFWSPPDSKWWGLGFITPGIATDFERVSSNAFQIAGLGLLGYKVSDSLSLAGGVFSSYAHEDGVVFPAVGFIWEPKPFIVQVTPPFLVFGWRATDKFTFSLSAYPSGGSWDVRDAGGVRTIDFSGWQGAASVIWRATDRVSVSVRGGVNFRGELELRDGSENVLLDRDLDPAPFGALNLRFQF